MRRKTRRFRWDRFVGCAVSILLLAITTWVVLSYLNVITHNMDEQPEYQVWNLFNYVS